jgi:hypothetical protein
MMAILAEKVLAEDRRYRLSDTEEHEALVDAK